MKVLQNFGGLALVLTMLSVNATAQVDKIPVGPVDQIKVCFNKTTMLVFPANIKDADHGSGDIMVRPVKRTANVLKVKAAKQYFQPTNLSVITVDGKLYSINVFYDDNPRVFAYHDFLQSSANAPVTFDEGMSDYEIASYARQISLSRATKRKPAVSNNRMRMRLRNIYINDGLLFFAFSIENDSDIPFDIHFTRFYLRDLAQTKRTSSMEKEIEARHVYFSTDSTVTNQQTTMMVVAFDKFTIANKKKFSVELYEHNGDRQLSIPIRGKHILSAKPFVAHAGTD